MEQERAVALLGTFAAVGGAARCGIIDWDYVLDDREYVDDVQIVVETPDGNRVRAGVMVDIVIPESGEVPVYAELDGTRPRRLVADATLWVPEGGTPVSGDLDLSRAGQGRGAPLGYVTARGGSILFAETDFYRLCVDQIDYEVSQITAHDEGPEWRVGVYARLTTLDDDREYPVYAEYEGEMLARVIVDLEGLPSS